MEMRLVKNIEGLGSDLTHQLRPLAFSLSDSFLHTHCSACFHPLPTSTHHPTTNPTPINYCSPPCSSLDSPLHFTTGEHHLFLTLHSHPTTYWHSDTSDLRTALRLLHHFTHLNLLNPPYSDRIGGLLTNFNQLKQQDEIYARIKEGGRLMAVARRLPDCRGYIEKDDQNTEVEEMVLCIVLTNAVEVLVNEIHGLGVAVYGPKFSWINHSCAPNACYRFSIDYGPPDSSQSGVESTLRIGAFGDESVVERNYENGEDELEYGPSIMVRSIKPIKKGDEVFVTYTNLLQPKATRDIELWSRYTFNCLCTRCTASPPSYVDCVLHGNFVSNLEPTDLSWHQNFCKYGAYEEISDVLDEIISEYLSIGNSETCCQKLENMLFQRPKKGPEEDSWPTFNLHPLCHLSLNAYVTLASAYKIRASELLSTFPITDNYKFESFALSRISAAYSLLVAGVTHHLFLAEHSFIVSAAHFWISAGESLLGVAKRPTSDSILARSSKCPLMDILKEYVIYNGSQSISTEVEFEDISMRFMNCALTLSSKVWPFLIKGRDHLQDIKDPIDYTWLQNSGNAQYCGLKCEAEDSNHEPIGNVFQLGNHCLLYGGYLASICYGHPCYWTVYVKNLLE